MKKTAVLLIVLVIAISLKSQKSSSEEKSGGFKKENLFSGGALNVGFFNGQTVLGLSPVFGYSLNNYIDAGIALNFTYTGIREYSGDKYRQFVYGPGVFAKIYPLKMIFIEGMYEHNFTSVTYKPAYGGPDQKYKADANSILVGGGYCTGREGAGSNFYYFSILVDILKDPNSPYVELLQNNTYRAIPIIKAGLQIPLFQGGGKRRR
jgi:hypothetical protein